MTRNPPVTRANSRLKKTRIFPTMFMATLCQHCGEDALRARDGAPCPESDSHVLDLSPDQGPHLPMGPFGANGRPAYARREPPCQAQFCEIFIVIESRRSPALSFHLAAFVRIRRMVPGRGMWRRDRLRRLCRPFPDYFLIPPTAVSCNLFRVF